jgi:hypothetical protein
LVAKVHSIVLRAPASLKMSLHALKRRKKESTSAMKLLSATSWFEKNSCCSVSLPTRMRKTKQSQAKKEKQKSNNNKNT